MNLTEAELHVSISWLWVLFLGKDFHVSKSSCWLFSWSKEGRTFPQCSPRNWWGWPEQLKVHDRNPFDDKIYPLNAAVEFGPKSWESMRMFLFFICLYSHLLAFLVHSHIECLVVPRSKGIVWPSEFLYHLPIVFVLLRLLLLLNAITVEDIPLLKKFQKPEKCFHLFHNGGGFSDSEARKLQELARAAVDLGDHLTSKYQHWGVNFKPWIWTDLDISFLEENRI